MKIKNITAREILDSKGYSTIEAQVTLVSGVIGMAKAPSGASTGKYEAIELRDEDGKGVSRAVANINEPINKLLTGQVITDQAKIDQLMITADGTPQKSQLGGNAMTAVSMAVCRTGAQALQIPLYQYIGRLSGHSDWQLPQPMILVIEGGKHGNWATDIQEFMIVPKKDKFISFQQAFRAGQDIFAQLEQLLLEQGYSTTIGMEGGFCPPELRSNGEALELIIEAIRRSGYGAGKEIAVAIDVAASEFFCNGQYQSKSREGFVLTPQEWEQKVINWAKQYHIWSIEDPFDQEEWSSWVELTAKFGGNKQIVGDDLLVTNINRIKKAIDLKAVNSVLIKVNQIGTVTETLQAIKLARKAGFSTVVSHRAGETDDSFIADLAVGADCGQCKFGGPKKAERVVKYKRLLKIERELRGK